MKVALLCPTRGRPKIFARMAESARATASQPIEIVARVDDDDPTLGAYPPADAATIFVEGPRIREITALWNDCFAACHGDIVCQANDDIIFRTPGWDAIVEAAFAACPDHILMVHGDHLGGYDGRIFGPHPFVHRRWVETLGYFIPPYFCSDHGDTWINDIANALGRRQFLPFIVEHMHFGVCKAEIDDTTRDRLRHHDEDHPEALYEFKLPERVRDAQKLAALMSPPRKIEPTRFFTTRSAGECPRCHEGSTVFVGNQIVCNTCGHSWGMT